MKSFFFCSPLCFLTPLVTANTAMNCEINAKRITEVRTGLGSWKCCKPIYPQKVE